MDLVPYVFLFATPPSACRGTEKKKETKGRRKKWKKRHAVGKKIPITRTTLRLRIDWLGNKTPTRENLACTPSWPSTIRREKRATSGKQKKNNQR